MPLNVKWPFRQVGSVPTSWMLTSRMVMASVGSLSKIWAEWLNRVQVYNKAALLDAVENRPRGQPLLTISNHRSCCDDPVLWGVLKWRHLFANNALMRWSLAASDVCFTKEWHSKFFSYGQSIPICRGDGVYQKGMDYAIEKMNGGAWVHTFPEGKVNETNEAMRLKWGVGRLIAECQTVPIVLPMWHVGMDRILPNKSPYIPRIGKNVTLVIGEPLDVEGFVKQLKAVKLPPIAIRKEITDRIQDEFVRLKTVAERIDQEQGCSHL